MRHEVAELKRRVARLEHEQRVRSSAFRHEVPELERRVARLEHEQRRRSSAFRHDVPELDRRVARLEQEERLRSYDLPPWFWVMIATSILLSAITIAARVG